MTVLLHRNIQTQHICIDLWTSTVSTHAEAPLCSPTARIIALDKITIYKHKHRHLVLGVALPNVTLKERYKRIV